MKTILNKTLSNETVEIFFVFTILPMVVLISLAFYFQAELSQINFVW